MEDRSEGAASAAGRGVWGLDRGHFAMTRPGDPRLDEAGPFPLSLSTRLSGQPPPALLASIWGFCSHFQGAEDFSLSPKAERAVLARIIVIISILMALTFPGPLHWANGLAQVYVQIACPPIDTRLII